MTSLSGNGNRSSATVRAPALRVDLFHHDLDAFMTDLQIAIELGVGEAALHTGFDELLEGLAAELVAEERLMRRISYPERGAHHEAHEALVLGLESALRLWIGAEHGSFDSLLRFARTCLSQHRTSMDAALAAYVTTH